ncbi:DUF6302 family protein [Streptomyces guryensis]|uniref:SAM-dependent methyltransferase n=1 Tax=Streptomyces guryensis TaxID=2886947 RepID=A0A9Q3VXS9_9ACTN|nr:DUF6302 family protein [Streptomyces guryensis]MCD9880411.1 SAM-dependent methyltransferase [Streptomyces guryensis]
MTTIDGSQPQPHGGISSRCVREQALMAGRLADPALLDQAVEIKLGKDEAADTCLAVPLGGHRVAGEVTVSGWSQALHVLLALDGRPGFPDVRDGALQGSPIDAPRTVRWGLGTRLEEPSQRAQMWGYHEAGVRAYVVEQTREDARVPVTPMPEMPASPTVARIHDLLIGGGKDSYQADRQFVACLPHDDAQALSLTAVINRMHLPGVVAHLTAQGIDQFLDLGCGMQSTHGMPRKNSPTEALHAIVARYRDNARVVYADHDRRLLGSFNIWAEGHPLEPEWVQGDIRYMEQFLSSGRVQYLLDWSRPIGVLLHDVLPWIDNDKTVTTALAVLREQLPPGSALSVTHAADLGENRMMRFTAAFRKAGIAFKPRDAAAIQALFGDWPLEPPGLVPTHRWHPGHPHAELAPHMAGALAGLAFKPENNP